MHIFEVSIFILLLVSLFLIKERFLNQEADFICLHKTLIDLHLKTLSGNIEFNPLKDFEILNQIIDEAIFRGVSINQSLDSLSDIILKEETYKLNKQRIISIIIFRIVSLLGMALFARIYLSRQFDFDLINSEKTGIISGVFILFSFFCSVLYFFPRSWFFHNELTDEAKSWLIALFLRDVKEVSPFFEQWKHFENIEVFHGIPQISSKNLILTLWKTKNDLEYQKRLRIFEDALPAFEFIFMGISLALILGEMIFTILI